MLWGVMDGVALHRQGNDALVELELDSLSDDELEATVLGLHREKQRLCANEARLLAAYDARRVFASDGSRTAAARVARKTHACRATVRGQVTLGRRLRLMPKVSAALAVGEITIDHAQVLGRLAGSARQAIADAFVQCEDQLVGFARDLLYDDFLRAVRYWEQAADQDGAEDKATKQRQSRRLHLSQTLDDMFVLDGLLDPIGGTIVATALGRIEREMFEQEWADAREIHGDDTRVEHLWRTPAQRRADALVEMAQRAMAMPKGARKPRPLITVHIGYETFAGRLCELSTGTVISPGQILPLITEADIERAVFDGPKRIIELGERTRFFTGGLRRCIEIAHRYCTHPGCDVPAEDCEIDHIVEYEDGGLTVQTNGDPKCKPHNIDKHNQKIKTRQAEINGREPPWRGLCPSSGQARSCELSRWR